MHCLVMNYCLTSSGSPPSAVCGPGDMPQISQTRWRWTCCPTPHGLHRRTDPHPHRHSGGRGACITHMHQQSHTWNTSGIYIYVSCTTWFNIYLCYLFTIITKCLKNYFYHWKFRFFEEHNIWVPPTNSTTTRSNSFAHTVVNYGCYYTGRK